jgi:hypothetical protein
MLPSPPLPQTEEPLDAIVYDVHPALAAVEAYPYAARPAFTPKKAADAPYGAAAGTNPAQRLIDALINSLPLLNIDAGRKADYVVPQRFGMSAIFGIMTALAVLFGALHYMQAPPVVYLFFGVQAIVICIAQMFQGQTPRAASALAGAILLPAFVMLGVIYSDHGLAEGWICFAIFSIPFGAFLGYLTGTCAAGVFLLMDGLERYLKGQRPIFPTSTGSTSHGAAA